MTPTPALADEIEALAKKATPGPLKIYGLRSRSGDLTISAFAETGPTRHVAYMSWDADAGGRDDASLIVALVNSAPTIVSALREVSALKEEVERLRGAVSHADRCERFVKLVAGQRMSVDAREWYTGEYGDDGDPDFEGAYDTFIEQARNILTERRAALTQGGE